MTSKQPHPQRCENKMTGDVITLSKDEYERLAAYRKRVIPYMCPDEAKDWQVFFDLVETRTHSSAAEPAPDLSHIREDRRGCLNCLNPDCPVWQTADQNCWKSQKEHDAATKQAAREEVIQQFIDFGMSGKCVKTDKAVSCDAICERDCFVCFAESLRGGDAP